MAAAREMQLTMKKTAIKPLLYEMQDFGVWTSFGGVANDVSSTD
jgi:hypothetical protein